ncbi:MAG: hypothetical protein ACXVHS_08100 [Methanobacterium sp.]
MVRAVIFFAQMYDCPNSSNGSGIIFIILFLYEQARVELGI